MAQPVSLGNALGLRAQPIDRTNQNVAILMQQRKDEQDAIDAARAAQAKSLANIDKYKNDMDNWLIKDASGIVPPLQIEVKAKTAELFDHIKKRKSESDSYNIFNDDEARRIKFDLGEIVSRNQISSKAYLNDVKKATENPSKFKINTKFTDAVGGGTYEEWLAANDGIHGGSTKGTGIYTHGAIEAIEQAPEMPKLLGAMSSWAGQQKKIGTSDKASYTPDKVKADSWEVFTQTSPEWKATVANWEAKGFSEQEVIDNFKPRYLDLFDYKAAPEKSSGSGVLSASDVKDLPLNIFDSVEGKKKSVNYKGITLPSDANLNIANSQRVLDAETGRPIEAVDPETGKPAGIYVGQLDITGGGNVVNDARTLKGGKQVAGTSLYAKATLSDGSKVDVIVPVDIIEGQKEIAKQKDAINELKRLAAEKNKSKEKGGKEYKVKGKSYSESAIKDAAKASGMSIDEYIKEANK